MAYNQYENWLSPARLGKYLAACSNRRGKAMLLYRANIRLSQKLYAVIGLFEVVLRNNIDRHFIGGKGPSWLEDAVADGGYLDVPVCENAYHSVQEALFRLDKKYDHDSLIAALTLGFWTNVFGKHEYPASGNTVLSIFVNRPAGTNYKAVFKLLQKLNILRNRIAHHEPLCFDAVGAISTAMVTRRYALIKDLFHWLGCDHRLLLYGVDGVQGEIDFINRLQAGL